MIRRATAGSSRRLTVEFVQGDTLKVGQSAQLKGSTEKPGCWPYTRNLAASNSFAGKRDPIRGGFEGHPQADFITPVGATPKVLHAHRITWVVTSTHGLQSPSNKVSP